MSMLELHSVLFTLVYERVHPDKCKPAFGNEAIGARDFLNKLINVKWYLYFLIIFKGLTLTKNKFKVHTGCELRYSMHTMQLTCKYCEVSEAKCDYNKRTNSEDEDSTEFTAEL